MTPGLLKKAIKLAEEDGGDGRHFLLLQLANRKLLAHNPYSPELPEIQMVFASDMLKLLNDELHHDGAWFFLFTHPHPTVDLSSQRVTFDYHRMLICWMDADGDTKAQLEWVRDGNSEELEFEDVMLQGRESWGDKCEAVWQLTDHFVNEVLDPREGETFKQAQGQAAPSQRH